MQALLNKYALITGVCERYTQQSLNLMAENGLEGIIIADNDPQQLEVLSETIAAKGTPCHSFAVDFARPEQITELFQFVRKQFPRLDILVHGVRTFPTHTLEELDATLWDECLNINLRSAHLCTREALSMMRPCLSGKIVYLSSLLTTKICGKTPAASLVAAHGGLVAMMKYYAKVYGNNENININAVCPNLRPNPDHSEENNNSVAASVLFLSSVAAKDINGVSLDVSGRSCYCNRIF